MNSVLTGLIAACCSLLPARDRTKYRREWTAELHGVAFDHGRFAALRFAGGIVLTTPRTAFALWTRPDNPFREAIHVLLAVMVPCVFFLGYAVASQQPRLLGAHLGLLFGVLLVMVGTVRNLRHPLHSLAGRVGLTLAITFGVVLTFLNQFGGVTNPVLDGTYRIYPGSSVTMLGFALLLASGLAPRLRIPMIQTGLVLIMAGTFVWAVLVIANTALATSWISRASQVVAAPALFAASYAAAQAFRRPETYRQGDTRSAATN